MLDIYSFSSLLDTILVTCIYTLGELMVVLIDAELLNCYMFRVIPIFPRFSYYYISVLEIKLASTNLSVPGSDLHINNTRLRIRNKEAAIRETSSLYCVGIYLCYTVLSRINNK